MSRSGVERENRTEPRGKGTGMQVSRLVMVACALLGACASSPPSGVANEIVEAPGASGMGFGDPSRAVDGVRGGGAEAQSLDVYSIPPREHLVLGWAGHRVVDVPGPDLAVFENAFDYGEGVRFMDPTIVEVSADGETWVAFPHDYVADDESVYSPRPEHWLGFAGVTPVHLHEEENALDPFDPAAGGDRFDLADLPEAARAPRFVRLSAASRAINPDTNAAFVRDPVSDGADIDGVIAHTLEDAP